MTPADATPPPPAVHLALRLERRARRLLFLAGRSLVHRVRFERMRTIGAWLGELRFRLGFVARWRMVRELAALVGRPVDDPRVRAQMREAFRSNDTAVLEVLKMLDSPQDPAMLLAQVELEGVEVLREALAAGRGAILLATHAGNASLLAVRLVASGIPVSMAYRESRMMDVGFFGRGLAFYGIEGILATEGLKAYGRMLSALRANRVVFVMADQGTKKARDGVVVRFLGKDMPMPAGPAQLARHANAPVLPVATIGATPRWRFEILPPVPRQAGASVEADLEALLRVCEGLILRNPQWWSWHHRRWRKFPLAPRGDAPAASKPGSHAEHRAGTGDNASVGFTAATPDFALQTASARKILIVEVAGLGDLVHSLPAMAAIRETYPNAELHCLVRREYASLLRLAPWIDRIWPYARGRTLNPGSVWRTVRALRAERFDLAIDLMGSDHASTAAWLSGAPRRLVRRPGPRRRRFAWRWFGTDVIEFPFGRERMYLQRWRSLQQAGIRSAEPAFKLLPAPSLDDVLGADAGRLRYIHVSPYTKRAHKELPPAQMAEVLQRLREAEPELRVVISCPNQPRDRRALDELLRSLSFVPWRVFAGTLDIPQLHALIAGAALHLSGDTASMHLAWLAGTPSVSWISALSSHGTWAPQGEQHAVVFSTPPPQTYLVGVSTEEIVARSLERIRVLPGRP